jgi:hypothetical protein
LENQRLGVFTIIKQIDKVAFQLKFLDYMKVYPMFHVSLLKLYHASTIPGKTHEPPPQIIVDGEQKYKVEEILNLKISHRQSQYLVHWQSYDINKCI